MLRREDASGDHRLAGGTVHAGLADHHEFQASDLAGLGARPVVVTAKDAVKLRAFVPPDLAVYVLAIEIDWLRGLETLDALLSDLPVGRARRERAALHEGLHG